MLKNWKEYENANSFNFTADENRNPVKYGRIPTPTSPDGDSKLLPLLAIYGNSGRYLSDINSALQDLKFFISLTNILSLTSDESSGCGAEDIGLCRFMKDKEALFYFELKFNKYEFVEVEIIMDNDLNLKIRNLTYRSIENDDVQLQADDGKHIFNPESELFKKISNWFYRNLHNGFYSHVGREAYIDRCPNFEEYYRGDGLYLIDTYGKQMVKNPAKIVTFIESYYDWVEKHSGNIQMVLATNELSPLMMDLLRPDQIYIGDSKDVEGSLYSRRSTIRNLGETFPESWNDNNIAYSYLNGKYGGIVKDIVKY